MISLDRQKICEAVSNLRSSRSKDYSEIYEALGGEEVLLEVFDKYGLKGIVESLVESGKIHTYIDEKSEDGLDILEGLLNKQIVGNIGKFYNINPDYIINLPPEQKFNIARAFSEGNIELEKTLMMLWGKGIKTIACDGDRNRYIQLEVNVEQPQEVYTRIFEQYKEADDIRFWVFGYNDGETYHFQLEGNDSEVFFPKIQEAFSREYAKEDYMNLYQIARDLMDDHYMNSYNELQLKKEQSKDRQDISELQDFIEWMKQKEGLQEDEIGWTDEKVEALIADNDRVHIEERENITLEKNIQIQGLEAALSSSLQDNNTLQTKIKRNEEELKRVQSELSLAKKENDKLKAKYKEASTMFRATREFIVDKLGKIPIIGRAIIKAMNKELNNKALSKNIENSSNKDKDDSGR